MLGADCPLSTTPPTRGRFADVAGRYREDRWDERYDPKSVSNLPACDEIEPVCAVETACDAEATSAPLAVAPSDPSDEPVVTRIGLVAYLLAMWNLLWSAIRHPTKTTEIDLMTGQIVRHF